MFYLGEEEEEEEVEEEGEEGEGEKTDRCVREGLLRTVRLHHDVVN